MQRTSCLPDRDDFSALPYAKFDREVSHITETEQYNGQVVFNGILDCAKACLENGIPVGLGTDTGCPYVTHYDMWRELNYYHKYCGVSQNLPYIPRPS